MSPSINFVNKNSVQNDLGPEVQYMELEFMEHDPVRIERGKRCPVSGKCTRIMVHFNNADNHRYNPKIDFAFKEQVEARAIFNQPKTTISIVTAAAVGAEFELEA